MKRLRNYVIDYFVAKFQLHCNMWRIKNYDMSFCDEKVNTDLTTFQYVAIRLSLLF